MMTHMPSLIPPLIARIQFFCVNKQGTKPSFSCFCLSHLMPCTCGSIIRGHRLQQVIIAPFSVEMRSSGRPSPTMRATCESVTRIGSGSTVSLIGTPFCLRSSSHVVFHNASRFFWSNAPTYDTKPAATIQSPIRQFVETFISSISRPQRSFSDARPPTNLSARPSFSKQASAISSTSCFSAVAASNLSCKACNSSSHLFTVA
mmetsp:Transcript_7546/g.21056  ORF Transcript_7546/g.21056 Transcript_7546/m.21056 type:complete len:203 (+) Transcript_7546:3048-3656(+)